MLIEISGRSDSFLKPVSSTPFQIAVESQQRSSGVEYGRSVSIPVMMPDKRGQWRGEEWQEGGGCWSGIRLGNFTQKYREQVAGCCAVFEVAGIIP